MNVQEQIKKYSSSQTEPKRSEMRELHRIPLHVSPECKLWFFDGKDSKMDIPGHVDHTFRGQTDHLFRGKPIKHSEACRSAIPRSSRSRICGCRNDLMGTSECIGERGGALDKPRAGRAPLEGGGTHTIGPTEDVHAENERNPTTALS